ncbi:MAG: BtaA family protein [Gammaproteobacteria bacterium]|nr:BtaA family protein [Gammaproteobacteria bacterium]
MTSEIQDRADFSAIRYAQCWEDADILLPALAIRPGDTCMAIASAGDNALAMVAQGARQVIALDMNPAQLACLELRIAAYRELTYTQLLELMGSRNSSHRADYYQRCRPLLSRDVQRFWDSHSNDIARGIGGAGKFERYFKFFREYALSLVHGRTTVERLLQSGTREARVQFYETVWDNRRWRWMFQIFFSRFMMGRLGRDPEFFRYVEGSVAEHILQHTRYALTELDPSDNPYLQWILTGRHITALPYALREENFEAIRNNIDNIEWHLMSIEQYLRQHDGDAIRCFNLSDIFEYMSEDAYHELLQTIVDASCPGGRLAYWNMLVPRQRPSIMAEQLQSLTELSIDLYKQDKAFFYSAFVVEEVTG